MRGFSSQDDDENLMYTQDTLKICTSSQNSLFGAPKKGLRSGKSVIGFVQSRRLFVVASEGYIIILVLDP